MTPRFGNPLPLFLVVLMVALGGQAVVDSARGTPLYSAREGRTCDNCHVTPNRWENPPLADRKCTMSCASCHVDPAGGGLRNASGRFFGRATLPMVATGPRPTMDWDRGAFGFGRHDRMTSYTDLLPLGPNDHAAARDSAWAVHDLWALGTPAGSPSRYSLFPGRYGDLRADPLFRFGWDFRAATLVSQGAVVFPMQADLQAALQPVEHLTLLAAVGARGRTRGFAESLDRPGSPYLRQAFLLLHEAPYQSYLKAGRFVPNFGLRLDNHTAFIRRGLDIDDGLPEARVTGVEIGANPNYPVINASWFRLKSSGVAPDAFDPFDFDRGHGYSVNLGYREMGWAVGASWMARRRPLGEGGDATATGGYVMLNPWKYRRGLPLTWQAEFDHLRRQRASGRETTGLFFYQELDYLLGNGVNLLAVHEWQDPDREVRDDEAVRISAGAQVTPIPGITVDGRIRGLLPAGGRAGADFFLQLHFWN